MGKINYSISPRVVNIAERTLAKKKDELGSFVPEVKFFATAQTQESMSLEKLANHISQHHSKYGKGDVLCVLDEMVSCVHELLLQGYKISLGELGEFYISLTSKGAEYYDEFSAQNIEKVNVNWKPGKDLKNLRQEANFELVETRKAVAANLKLVRESYPTRPQEEKPGESGNTGGQQNGSNTQQGGSTGGQTTGGGTVTPPVTGGDNGLGE